MGSIGSYNVSDSHRDVQSEVDRLRAQALLSWEWEAQKLILLGLNDGMNVVELGSGPGFITEQLLGMLPSSRITALEIDPGLIQRSKDNLKEIGGERVEYAEASITDTRFPENHFDFAVARLIFQHLPEPTAAAKEVFRILKPGGKLVILDIDDAVWGLADPDVPEMDMIFEKFAAAQAAQGGNRFIGRRLWRIMHSAGFQNLKMDAVVAQSDELGIEAFMPQIDPDRLLPLQKAGLISQAEIEQIRSAREIFLSAENPFILTIMLLICGEKG